MSTIELTPRATSVGSFGAGDLPWRSAGPRSRPRRAQGRAGLAAAPVRPAGRAEADLGFGGRAGSLRVAGATLRLTVRGRLVLLVFALLVVTVPVLLGARGAAADGPESAPVVQRHVVQPGETLWQVASGIARPGEDVRDVVHELVVLNGLPDSSLYAGETIGVPIDR